jgi:ketosteroid isomerase-like protein
MKTDDPEEIALGFVKCINNQDLEGLVALMTDDHVFIDYGGRVMRREVMIREGWPGYFSQYPEYRIHVSKITRSGNDVAITGVAAGTPLN